MALETKIEFLSQSRDGREVIVRDATGSEPGNPNGYGVTNGEVTDILAHYFVATRMTGFDDHVLRIDGTDPLLPTNEEIAEGAPVKLTTSLFENGTYDCSELFIDGVLNFDMYVEFEGLSGVVIEEGNNFIYFPEGDGRDFEDAYDGDAVTVDGVIYQIDKSIDNNNFTVLYILGEFESDQSSFNYLYRANTKALLTAMGESLHSYACDRFRSDIESREWNTVNTALSFRRAAYGFFTSEVPDYAKANDLAASSLRLLNRYKI